MDNLWEKFSRATCEDGVDVQHVKDMIAMSDELVYHGRSIDWITFVSTTISSLSSQYKYLEGFYTLSDSTWSIDSLINKINHQEDGTIGENKDNKVVLENPYASNVELKPQRNFLKKNKGGKSSKKFNQKMEINAHHRICFFCQKHGHIQKICWAFL